MSSKFTTRVVSMCSKSHMGVWRLTSELLTRFVKADEYFVYVPQNEIDDFRRVTNSSITVRSQESLDVGFGKLLLEEVKEKSNYARFGWYLQQFYKIQALIESPTSSTIIWDADCVPTRNIQIFNEKNQPVYMRATENHPPYFEMMERFLGLPIVQNQSFVIPGFPILNRWTKEFVEFVEDRHRQSTWFEAIIQDTDFGLQSGFSETETLGTWIANSYPDSWTSIDLNWERLGQSRFNYAKRLSPASVVALGEKHNLDIISFENWDLRGMRGRLNYLITLRQNLMPKWINFNHR